MSAAEQAEIAKARDEAQKYADEASAFMQGVTY
jgi:hypothetical protein